MGCSPNSLKGVILGIYSLRGILGVFHYSSCAHPKWVPGIPRREYGEIVLRNPYRGGSRSAVEFWVWGLGFFSSACVCILVPESLGLGVQGLGSSGGYGLYFWGCILL